MAWRLHVRVSARRETGRKSRLRINYAGAGWTWSKQKRSRTVGDVGAREKRRIHNRRVAMGSDPVIWSFDIRVWAQAHGATLNIMVNGAQALGSPRLAAIRGSRQ